MAFILDRLTNIRGEDKAEQVQGKWLYRTTDAKATVIADDYFLNAYTYVPSTDTTLTTSTLTVSCAGKFYIGDVIEVQQVDTDNNPLDEYNVLVVLIETGSSPTIITQELGLGQIVAVGRLDDISTASTTTITFGQTVDLVSIKTILGGTIATANDAITAKIGAVAVIGGDITVAYSGSAKGDVDTSSPTAARTGAAFIMATDGASTNTVPLDIILVGQVVTGGTEYVRVTIPDISTASSAAYAAVPVGGTITRIVSTLQGAITVADANITTNIGATPITGGALVIATAGSAAGVIDTAAPSAANVVVEGNYVSAVSDGGSTTAAALYVDFYISR